MSVSPVKVGVIGCGMISGAYLRQMKMFPLLQTVACADLVPEHANARAQEFEVPRACTPEQLLADPEVELVLNLTIPLAHYAVSRAALEAGKSVWTEKPLAVTREEGRTLLDLAAQRGLLLGCAPDTFLGGGHQTALKLLRDGWIGDPVGATAFFTDSGPESWHPTCEFIYQRGGGPIFDMGPYYLTMLVALLGPVARVSSATRMSYSERIFTCRQRLGEKIAVEVPTYVTGLLEFASGPVATLISTYDVWAARLPHIEVYGSQGSLSAPDPNGPGGPVRFWPAGAKEWGDVPLVYRYADTSRSLGVADMAYALRYGRPHRANGELAFHVLDVMHTLMEAAQEGCRMELASTCSVPAPLPLGLAEGLLDE